ncbi:hypothetical protein GCM10007989_38780 [Devosia pacifica]|uniref:Uncharacterized protein n=1 Tax=Devosia pacifica TaxID=1335967 RepID=A0A918SEW0_9HYPH|nr:hypothetical protein [Devosia pacifica]GHA39310.1 hypothetical protein GCM10007989_38780 [Devosia pacifica]
MADFSSTGAGAPDKTLSVIFPSEAASLINGLVQHRLLSPSDQVQILSIVDANEGATVGDIVIELPDHRDPVGATMLLVEAGVLTAEVEGVIDAFTVVRRAPPKCGSDPDLDDQGSETSEPPSGDFAGGEVSEPGIVELDTNPFFASVFVAAGDQRREFLQHATLRRPGVYVLMNSSSAYVGMAGDVGWRIAHGHQPIEGIETIVSVVDADDLLTAEDAKVLERIIWSRLAGSGERRLINGVPDGHAVGLERYVQLDAIAAEACLALRHNDVLFVEGCARSVIAGPRTEPGRLGERRGFDTVPAGEIFEMRFGGGLVAMASRLADTHWLLLRGSDVRIETVVSANASASYLRAAWLHSGLLALSPDGRSYTVMRDLVFGSGSAAAHFCCGSKGKGLSGWQPIDPDFGNDAPVLTLS